jgi:hypothetical protein
MIAPDIECVVLTGMPNPAVAVNIAPPPVSAQNPWYGLKLVNLKAMVLTVLHPKESP